MKQCFIITINLLSALSNHVPVAQLRYIFLFQFRYYFFFFLLLIFNSLLFSFRFPSIFSMFSSNFFHVSLIFLFCFSVLFLFHSYIWSLTVFLSKGTLKLICKHEFNKNNCLLSMKSLCSNEFHTSLVQVTSLDFNLFSAGFSLSSLSLLLG